MDSKEIYDSIKELWEDFDSNHNVFVEKGNKAAAGRARKAIGEIKKLGKQIWMVNWIVITRK